MLNLVLFGPPGAGKGTQAENLINKYKLVHLSTGDILRNEIKNETELGIRASEYMNKGELVPDEVVIGMIDSKISQNKSANGFIFDGFPRTTNQAKALDNLLEKKGTPITGMLALEVSHDELVKRLLNRGKTSGRADDKDVAVIENRISVYEKETSPLIDYYSARHKFYGIKGIGSIDEIFQALSTTIDELNENK